MPAAAARRRGRGAATPPSAPRRAARQPRRARRAARGCCPTPPPARRRTAAGGRRRGRRLGALFAVLALVVVPLGLGAYIANQAVYFVGTDDDGFVTMYRGLPYALPAGIDLYSPTYVSGVPLRVAAARRAASA